MSFSQVTLLRDKIKKIGPWMGARYMRNQGIPFEQAYFVMFNRQPRV